MTRLVPRLLALCGNLAPLGLTCEPADLRLSDVPAEHVHEVLWHIVDKRLIYACAGPNGESRVAPAFTRRAMGEGPGVARGGRRVPAVAQQPALPPARVAADRQRRRRAAERSAAEAGSGAVDGPAEGLHSSRDGIHRALEGVRPGGRATLEAISTGAPSLPRLVGRGRWSARCGCRSAGQSCRPSRRFRCEQRTGVSAALVEAGDSAAADGRVQEAIDNYTQALKLAPDNTTALLLSRCAARSAQRLQGRHRRHHAGHQPDRVEQDRRGADPAGRRAPRPRPQLSPRQPAGQCAGRSERSRGPQPEGPQDSRQPRGGA